MALGRLNFPWAAAWFFLTPYALWVGGRYSFEAAQWRRRLPVVLAAGAGFIWVSQALSERLVAGQTMIVMVNYTADASVEKHNAAGDNPGDARTHGFVTNRFVTNRFTKVVLSGDATRPTDRAAQPVINQ